MSKSFSNFVTINNNFKKIAIVFITSAIPMFVNAYNFMVDGLCYDYNSDGTSVSVVLQKDGDDNYSNLKSSHVIIPDNVQYNGRIYNVTSVKRAAFHSCLNLESLTIGNSVKVIERDAFIGCKGLTTVTFGNSIEIIGEGAFAYCDNLKSVVVPDNVKEIGINAFVYNINLSSLSIGSGVTSVGENAFAYCFSLKDVTFYLDNIKNIENGVFHDSPFEDVTIFSYSYFSDVNAGKQVKLCTKCHGSGRSNIKCKACGGHGETWHRPNPRESYGILRGCTRCGGSGSQEMNGMTDEVYSDNDFVRGSGYLNCSSCRGEGYILSSTLNNNSKKNKTSRKKRR